jgi:hypothetical protein
LLSLKSSVAEKRHELYKSYLEKRRKEKKKRVKKMDTKVSEILKIMGTA